MLIVQIKRLECKMPEIVEILERNNMPDNFLNPVYLSLNKINILIITIIGKRVARRRSVHL